MGNIKELEELSEHFRELIGNEGLNYKFYDMLPIPMEIFTPDGMAIFVNRALLELNNLPDASLVVGKYNGQTDPLMIKILGQETLDRIRRGETVSFPDFHVPIQDVVDRGITDGKPFEAATMDLLFLPIWDGNVFKCSVCFFTVKNVYQGNADIVKAREYIDNHWLDEFDIDRIARSVNLSPRHLYRVFKEDTKETPLYYYQKVKIEKLKEKLLDNSYSIEQAFKACDVDYYGKTYRKLFKEKTGMTPTEYRKVNIK